MSRKTNVQTNLLGRQAFLNQENTEAAKRYIENVDPTVRSPWVKLHPAGGEIVAVYTDREGELNITVALTDGGELLTLAATWLRAEPKKAKKVACPHTNTQSHPSWSGDSWSVDLSSATECLDCGKWLQQEP